jgi:SAM-dependent methyltransferase
VLAVDVSRPEYVGTELETFAHASNWKRYWVSRVSRFVAGDVLEVGAGIGTNTVLLRALATGRWLCVEPDPGLLQQCLAAVQRRGLTVDAMCGTQAVVPQGRSFDTVLYIDVLEHIEDDAGELSLVAQRLRPRGHIIVLSPAHQGLYSEFDRAIGHYRRYDRQSLQRCSPAGASTRACEYLDSVGFFLSLANRVMLKQSGPTVRQILFWDRVIVPLSRAVDHLLDFRLGRSILGVWELP